MSTDARKVFAAITDEMLDSIMGFGSTPIARRLDEYRRKQKKTKLDSLSAALVDKGWKTSLTEDSLGHIIDAGLCGKNLPLAIVAAEIALQQHPLTLRGLFYRVVSAGWLPSTDKPHYDRMGRILTRLREAECVPFSWIVDNLRSTVKPSSWTGLEDFADTCRDAYRKDFWARLPEYVHIFCEKDAIAGTIVPVTSEFDVALSPIRGYASLSFAHEIADQWRQIEKPIYAYYVGDFDPSGFDLERDIREKLERYCGRQFTWERLAVLPEDFEAFDLIRLAPKKSDRRYRAFVKQHGSDCAELDALPATELRDRIKQAIEQHIPRAQWESLKHIEGLERETFQKALQGLAG